ncbi:MAG: limonene-1,2-epoxide hydrolase [Actinobacteria bacterium]|nr:limonene-1,2-epoxide hydrolase [Actinomycetota bacterium]
MTPEEIVDEFIARLVRLDVDAACELVTDDVEYDNVPMGPVRGPDGIKGVFAQLSGIVGAMEWVIHRQVAAGNVVINERTDRFCRDGKWADLPVAGIFEVRDGKIALWRDYFDMNTMTTRITELLG